MTGYQSKRAAALDKLEQWDNEALKLALEALEFDGFTPDDATHRHYTIKAITAIKAAMAQPAQEPVAWMMPDGQIIDKWALQFYGGQAGKPLYTTPPQRTWVGLTEPAQQEPVAWGVFEGNLHDMFFTEAEAVEMAQLKGTHAEVKPLYTAPQRKWVLQREWVDLTDEEIDKWAHELHGVIYAVMAELKEKNT